MTTTHPSTETNRTDERWAVDYDVDPIRIRDPVAEALGVLEPGAPFVITYADVVRAAGHSCPTAAGAFRLAQDGLDALYPGEEYPVRSDIDILLPEPRSDPTYGVTSRLLSYVTGAAAEDGFGGLAGGYGDRRDCLRFDAFDAGPEPTIRLRRCDTDEAVEATYHTGSIPDGGPAVGHLTAIVEGTATDEQREAFAEAWHGRVRAVLADEALVSVDGIDG